METTSTRQQLVYLLMLYLLLLPVIPCGGHGGDFHLWFTWASHILEHGLGNAYQLQNDDYNPLYQYFLWGFGKWMVTAANIDYYRKWLKVFTLVFDFAGAFWAASLVPERQRRFGLMLLLLLNLGYLYNTLLWGQVDAIYTFFSFGAVVLAVQQRPVGSLLLFVLALAAKTQAIIFLPTLLLLWGPQWWQRPLRMLAAVGAGALLLLLLLAPFIWWSWESYLPRIIFILTSVDGRFSSISANAFNLWTFLGPEDLYTPDTQLLSGLTYHAWGLLLFCSSSALALLPLLVAGIRRLLPGASATGQARLSMDLVLLSTASIPLGFCFFNTQMHERYWHATVLFMGAYGFLRRDYLPFALVSVAYFLNLEAVLRFMGLPDYQRWPFTPQFVAFLFGSALVISLVKLYRLSFRQGVWSGNPAPGPTALLGETGAPVMVPMRSSTL